MRAQTVAERIYACELVLCNGTCGNAGPYLDDIRKVGHREADGITLRRQTIKALLHAYLARAQLGYARVSLLVCGASHSLRTEASSAASSSVSFITGEARAK